MTKKCRNCAQELNPFEIPTTSSSTTEALCANCRASGVVPNSVTPPPLGNPPPLFNDAAADSLNGPLHLERPPIFLLDPGKSPHLEDLKEQNKKTMAAKRAARTLKTIAISSWFAAVLSCAYLYWTLKQQGLI